MEGGKGFAEEFRRRPANLKPGGVDRAAAEELPHAEKVNEALSLREPD